jgi:hypothetical protein
MKDGGFGDTVCNNANDYVIQYVLNYKKGIRLPLVALEANEGRAQGNK